VSACIVCSWRVAPKLSQTDPAVPTEMLLASDAENVSKSALEAARMRSSSGAPSRPISFRLLTRCLRNNVSPGVLRNEGLERKR
jgi:hypothetical protein